MFVQEMGGNSAKVMMAVGDRPNLYAFKPFKITKHDSYSRNSMRIDQELPKPRSGHRIGCDEINMYSYGGYNPHLLPADERDLSTDSDWLESKPLFRELWKYNFASATWKKLKCSDIPDVLASNAVVMSGKILMVFGGTVVPFGANCSQKLYLCDLSDESDLSFKHISSAGCLPQRQYGQAIVLHNLYLYTIGGTTGYEYTCDVHRLNLRNHVWETIYVCKGFQPEPAGRYRHEVAFDGSKIYLLGGGTASEAFGFEEIYAFNITSFQWEKLATQPDNKARERYPSARRCHSCVQFHGTHLNAYILGGYDGHHTFSDIWKLDLVTLIWTKLAPFRMDQPVYFHSSAITPAGKLVTFGGTIQKGDVHTRTADVYTSWICIPKLKEICWEAILHYNADLHLHSKETLRDMGLPSEFVKRFDLHR